MKLVSAIMPARGRTTWAMQAVECFRRQTYRRKELLILDDADAPAFPSSIAFINEPDVHYFRAAHRWTIAKKRNDVARLALGPILMHFDSDDYSHPDRMADQVARLEESQKSVTGYHSMLFWDEATGKAYRYRGRPAFAIGTSLCYLRSFWEHHRFNEARTTEEDNEFVAAAAAANELMAVDGGSFMVARAHADNTSIKRLDAAEYQPMPDGSIPREFFA